MSSIGVTALAWSNQGLIAKATRIGLAAPGLALIGFEATRGAIALRETGPADIVLVLGCALIGDEPSDMLERRLRRAVAVVKRAQPNQQTKMQSPQSWSTAGATGTGEPTGFQVSEVGDSEWATTIVCCGGVGADSEDSKTPPSEAEVMATWLREVGLTRGDEHPENSGEGSQTLGRIRIVEEGTSTSTVENISNAIGLLRNVPADARVTVVTSDFHVPRVKQTIAKHSFDSKLGTGKWQVEGSWTPIRYWATSTLREFLAQPIVWVDAGRRFLRTRKNCC